MLIPALLCIIVVVIIVFLVIIMCVSRLSTVLLACYNIVRYWRIKKALAPGSEPAMVRIIKIIIPIIKIAITIMNIIVAIINIIIAVIIIIIAVFIIIIIIATYHQVGALLQALKPYVLGASLAGAGLIILANVISLSLSSKS